MEPEVSLLYSQVPATCPYPELCEHSVKRCFDGEDHPLSVVRNGLFNIFAATLHIGGRYSIRNLRTPHAVVTGTLLSRVPSISMTKTLWSRELKDSRGLIFRKIKNEFF